MIQFAFIFLSLLYIGLTPARADSNESKFTALRHTMVSVQIEKRGVSDPATLEAMKTVRRHLFVPKNATESAYEDHPLPIGYGQTISQPYIVGFMTEILHPEKTHKILEVGTGSGYQAAVLGKIVKEVYTIEIVPELGKIAQERLQKLGYDNVKVKIADGYHGWEDQAPFDAIVVTAAAEHIPPPLIKQLKVGGIMIIPVGHPFFVQNLVLVEKKACERNLAKKEEACNQVTTKNLLPVRFVPFRRAKP